jgi:hypothetical protein
MHSLNYKLNSLQYIHKCHCMQHTTESHTMSGTLAAFCWPSALILCVCVCACVCPYYCLTDLAASPVYERLVALATAAAERSGAGHYKHSKVCTYKVTTLDCLIVQTSSALLALHRMVNCSCIVWPSLWAWDCIRTQQCGCCRHLSKLNVHTDDALRCCCCSCYFMSAIITLTYRVMLLCQII